jgi:hypothetical protein
VTKKGSKYLIIRIEKQSKQVFKHKGKTKNKQQQKKEKKKTPIEKKPS